MSRQRRERQKAVAAQRLGDVFDTMTTLPDAAQSYFASLCASVCDAGNTLQLSPEQMLCGLGAIAAAVLLSHADPRDDPEIDRLIRYGGEAINVGTAMRRIELGAVGPRPDGSYGVKLDA